MKKIKIINTDLIKEQVKEYCPKLCDNYQFKFYEVFTAPELLDNCNANDNYDSSEQNELLGELADLLLIHIDNDLNAKQKCVIKLILKNYSQGQIANLMHVSQPIISRIYIQSVKILRKSLLENKKTLNILSKIEKTMF